MASWRGYILYLIHSCKFLPHSAISEEPAIRNMTFWKDGFQFDDGELRRYDDPTQTQILDEIMLGELWSLLRFDDHNQPFCPGVLHL